MKIKMINYPYDELFVGNSCGAANASVKLQSDMKISRPNLAISNAHDIWWLYMLLN